MPCYSVSARIIKMFSSWEQQAGPPVIMGKRGEEHYEKNPLLLSKVLCSMQLLSGNPNNWKSKQVAPTCFHLEQMAALCYIKKKRMNFSPSASFMGRRQTRCSCPQFLHVKSGAGTACQKKLNGMKMCSCSKSETAVAVSHPCVLRATPHPPPSSVGGTEPFLGWFSTSLSHSWGAVPAKQSISQLPAFPIHKAQL